MANKDIVMTEEGRAELQAEYDRLITEGRKEAAERIKTARGYGDLSENAEYDEAMSDQGRLEARISELEYMLSHAKIIDESELSSEHIHLGSTVRVKDDKKKEITYQIVGYAQANPIEGLISDESPIGKALIGHKVNDKVVVETPGGERKFKILEIIK